MTESDFYDAPCKNRCGELIPTRWEESTNQWVYERPCYTCTDQNRIKAWTRVSLHSTGLNDQEAQLTLESFKPNEGNQEAYDASRRMGMGDGINLYLHGKAGRGKTHLAVGIGLKRLITSKVLFFPVTKALMTIRGNMREMPEDEQIAKLVSKDILIIDDFGANKLTEWNLSFMDCLIDEWYRKRRKGLVVTSNFSLKDVSERISDRIASRLAQLCEVYELGGEDHRIL